MITAHLIRYNFLNVCTFGLLVANGEIYHTLELPWLNNKRNASCIPVGEYKCIYMAKSSSGKYRNVYHVVGVEGRSGILIHSGNLPEQTKGCVLIGRKRGNLASCPAVLNSRSALSDFVGGMNKQNFILKVKDYGMAS